MKNIHVLPTDKPSRFHLVYDKNYYLSVEPFIQLDAKNYKSFNIYITDGSKIQEEDFYLYCNQVTKRFRKNTRAEYPYPNYQKIILTTDQDLIKDGVQAIDDDFLEWFVKNPSCEEVEVDKGYRGVNLFNYKIIIPKEEPNPFELPKVLPDDVFYQSLEEPKQETLEGLLNKKAEQSSRVDLDDYANGLDDGVSPMNDLLKDLRETKISVKESIDIIEYEFIRTQINIFVQKTLDSVIDRIENELLEKESKWQQEQDKKMYSEEEVLEQLNILMSLPSSTLDKFTDDNGNITIKWFEQFKKK
jgi:hypothetical protein